MSIRAFVGKIPQSVGKESLQQHFAQYGNVTDVYLPASNQGKPSKIAFVTFEDEKGLYATLAAEHVVQGHAIRVTKATPKGQPGTRIPRPASMDNARLFVGNLHPSTTEANLRDHFSQFGTVVTCIVHQGKRDRGYAFVSFASPQEMFQALGAAPPVMNGAEAKVVEAEPKQGIGLGSRPYQPPMGHRGYDYAPYPPSQGYEGYGYGGYAAPPSRRRSPARDSKQDPRIFLTPPQNTDESELKQYFAQYGTVKDVFMPRGRSNIAFVTMSSTTELYAALAAGPHILKDFDMKAIEAKPKGMPSMPPTSSRRLPRIFVGRIPPNVQDSHLKAHFEKYGTITDVYRPKSNKRQDSQIAFCVFEEDSSLYACLAAGSPQTVNGAEITVTRAQPRPTPSQYAEQSTRQQPYNSYGYGQAVNPSVNAYGGYNPYMQAQAYGAEYSSRSRGGGRYTPY